MPPPVRVVGAVGRLEVVVGVDEEVSEFELEPLLDPEEADDDDPEEAD